jgi:hypothetical protein
MKEYHGFKYKISVRSDGHYDFDVWAPDAKVGVHKPVYSGTVATEAEAERRAKAWIDDRQPSTRKRPKPARRPKVSR